MNPRLLLASLSLAAAFCAPGVLAADNELTPAEKSAGWQLLFDGKSFDGWRGYRKEKGAPVNGWEVVDGTLHAIAKVRGTEGHVILVGLGAVGIRVLEGLRDRGREVVVIERDEDNRYASQARLLGVRVIIGDATLARTLEAANIETASANAVVTSNDMTNIETGLVVRDALGDRWTEVPVILRVFDTSLGHRLEETFDFRHVWSTAAIAAPWFVGAAIGMGVLATFYVGKQPFLVARLAVRGKDYHCDGPPLAIPGVKYTLTGVGPFLHERPEDRPPEIFAGRHTLHFAPGRMPYVLLPVIP